MRCRTCAPVGLTRPHALRLSTTLGWIRVAAKGELIGSSTRVVNPGQLPEGMVNPFLDPLGGESHRLAWAKEREIRRRSCASFQQPKIGK